MFELTIKGTSLEELYASAEVFLQLRPCAIPASGNALPPITAALSILPSTSAPAAPTIPAPVPPTVSATPQPTTSPSNGVPVAAAPTYTLDQLAKAGATLAQSGKMDDALALLAKYNVQSVTQLNPEHYGAFATELRALGAQV